METEGAKGAWRRRDTLVWLAIWLVFALHAGWPVPDPNEPHYLGKAKHFWNASWIPQDDFLDSPDTHLAFYATCGWLTLVAPLSAVAWIGRAVTWGLMAWTWLRLSRSILPGRFWHIVSAALFVTLNEHVHMAGEWVVGGFEAKGLAYALVFEGLRAVILRRWNAAWTWLGAASALHVLVGGWSVIAAVFAYWMARRDRAPLLTMAPGLALGAGLAALGIVPALAMNWGQDAAILTEANEIYVYRRLAHHLVASRFPVWFLDRHLLLAIGWIFSGLNPNLPEALRRLRPFVWGAMGIALVGFLLSAMGGPDSPRITSLLRFYWFRLSDAMLPLGVAFHLVHSATCWKTPGRKLISIFWLGVVLAASGAHLWSCLRARLDPPAPRADKGGKVVNYADWVEACDWIAENSPRDARFLTPRMAQTFKWRSGRSEVVTWKDIPQDSRGIVEWWRRLREIHGRRDDPSSLVFSDSLSESPPERLEAWGRKYQAGYLLTEAEPALDLECLHRNTTYAIYRFR